MFVVTVSGFVSDPPSLTSGPGVKYHSKNAENVRKNRTPGSKTLLKSFLGDFYNMSGWH